MKHNLGIIRFISILATSLLGISCLEASLTSKAARRLSKAIRLPLPKPANPVFLKPTVLVSPKGLITAKQMDKVNAFFSKYPSAVSKNAARELNKNSKGLVRVSGPAFKNILLQEASPDLFNPSLFKLFKMQDGYMLTASNKPAKINPLQDQGSQKIDKVSEPKPNKLSQQQMISRNPAGLPNVSRLFTNAINFQEMLYGKIIRSPASLWLPKQPVNMPTAQASVAHFPLVPLNNPSAMPSAVQPLKPSSNKIYPVIETFPEESAKKLYEVAEAVPSERTVEPIDTIERDRTTGKVAIQAGKRTYYISEEEYKEIKDMIKNMEENPYLDRNEKLFIPFGSRNGLVVDFAAGTIGISTKSSKNYAINYAEENPAEYGQEAPTLTYKNQETPALQYSTQATPEIIIPEPTVKLDQGEVPLITEEGGRQYMDLNSSEFEVTSTPPPPLTRITRATDIVTEQPTVPSSTTSTQNAVTTRRVVRKVPHGDPGIVTSAFKTSGSFNPNSVKISELQWNRGVMPESIHMHKFTEPTPGKSLGLPHLFLGNPLKLKNTIRLFKIPGYVHPNVIPSFSTQSGSYTHDTDDAHGTGSSVPLLGVLLGTAQPDSEDKEEKASDSDNVMTDTPILTHVDSLKAVVSAEPDPTPAKFAIVSDEELGDIEVPPMIAKKKVYTKLPVSIPSESEANVTYHSDQLRSEVNPASNVETTEHKFDDITIPPKPSSAMTSTPPVPVENSMNVTHQGAPLKLEAAPVQPTKQTVTPAQKQVTAPQSTPTSQKDETAKQDADKKGEDNSVVQKPENEQAKAPAQSTPAQSPSPFSSTPFSSTPAPSKNSATSAAPKASAAPASKPSAAPAVPSQPSTNNSAAYTPTPPQPQKFRDPAGVAMISGEIAKGNKVPEHADAAKFQLYPQVPLRSHQATYRDGHATHPMQEPAKLKLFKPTFGKPTAAIIHAAPAASTTVPVDGSTWHNTAWGVFVKIALYAMVMCNLVATSMSVGWLKGILRLFRVLPA